MAHKYKIIIVECNRCHELQRYTLTMFGISYVIKCKFSSYGYFHGNFHVNFQRNYHSYKQMVDDLEKFGCNYCGKGYDVYKLSDMTNTVTICERKCNECLNKFKCYTSRR